jgi:hypothetical protein
MASIKRPSSPISDTSSVLTSCIDDEDSSSSVFELAEELVSTLNESLHTESGKNVAECVEEMTDEIRKLNLTLKSLVQLLQLQLKTI